MSQLFLLKIATTITTNTTITTFFATTINLTSNITIQRAIFISATATSTTNQISVAPSKAAFIYSNTSYFSFELNILF